MNDREVFLMRERFYRFMQGRYGANGADELYRFQLIAAVVLLVVNLFVKNNLLAILEYALLIWALFRLFSRNYQARYRENQKFLDMTSGIRYRFDQSRRLHEERKYHRIYKCPKCGQKIRIPKGKGRIMVRCPKCYCEFQRRS